MFLTKIFHFCKGYVILSVTGENKEKIIAKIARDGYRLSDVQNDGEEITARLAASDIRRIKNLPQEVKIRRLCGFPSFWETVKKQKPAAFVLCTFLLIAAIGAQFIWSIDFDADKDVRLEEVKAAAELAGLKTGAFKGALKKPEEIKNIILNHTDGICWCWVYIKGTRAIIRVRKSVIPPEIFPQDTPCDIIAMRSGIIKRVISQKGRCAVEENQAVTAGETLISGTIDFGDAEGYQVHSRGLAEAYTTHTSSGVFEQSYCYKTYTGRLQRFLTLKLYKWELPLYIKDRVRFGNYDSERKDFDARIGRDNYIGIGLRVDELKEYELQKEPISYETAAMLAQNRLERDISRELLPGAQLISKSCDVQRLDGQRLSVTVTMDFIEEIGTEKRIEEVTVVEPKNNQSAGGA